MTEDHSNAYEGLFLFPQAQAGNLQAALDHLKEILSRAEAQVISLRKWEERRLAFEIKGNKRGVYFLVYFRAPGTAIRAIERACNLSELLLRSLILRADHLTQEQMEAADGTAELADEIRLSTADAPPAAKAPQPADDASQSAPDAGGTAGGGPAVGNTAEAAPAAEGEAAEPITVETETPAKDPATTIDG